MVYAIHTLSKSAAPIVDLAFKHHCFGIGFISKILLVDFCVFLDV